MTKKAASFRGKNYYAIAHKGSSDLSHPAMKVLRNYAKSAEKIIDLGCGEGTRLYEVTRGLKVEAYGIDQSSIAIEDAEKHYPKIKFREGNLEDITFEDNTFDLIFSAYVFEHLENPEKVLMEAKRILINSGKIVIIAPNYGSPNRRSPNSDENQIEKLLKGFFGDFNELANKKSGLGWHKVKPKLDKYIFSNHPIPNHPSQSLPRGGSHKLPPSCFLRISQFQLSPHPPSPVFLTMPFLT